MPTPGRNARDPLFTGSIYFAHITFHTNNGDLAMLTADMNQIVAYGQHAVVPVSEYASAYGTNHVTVASNLLSYSANVPSGTFTDGDLQSWVNDMVSTYQLPSTSCIFVICPSGISASEVGGNSGYHGKSSKIPYIVAGVYSTGLTLADSDDVYAMVVSHEMAEMIVDPNVDGANPEVCDPCDINCGNLTRCYFSAGNSYLGSNQDSPPAGFSYAYYICAIVKPAGASTCPATSAQCEYAPTSPVIKLKDHKEVKELKEHKEHKEGKLEKAELEHMKGLADIPKLKDAEGPGQVIDPGIAAQLGNVAELLSREAEALRAFIQPSERPALGQQAVKAARAARPAKRARKRT